MIGPQPDLVPMPAAALAAVRGRLIANAPIGRQTWFGAGGSAEMLFRPADRDDLAAFLPDLPPEVPITVDWRRFEFADPRWRSIGRHDPPWPRVR